MKVLWLCNNSPLTEKRKNGGGWYESLAKAILASKKIELVLLFPKEGFVEKTIVEERCSFYCFKQKRFEKEYKVNKKRISYFYSVLKNEDPDVIHIWGTEYAHSLELFKAASSLGLEGRIALHIQGFCFECANYIDYGIPSIYKVFKLPKDFVVGGIKDLKKKFQKRGINEFELIKSVKYVCGRTDWDKDLVNLINPKASYLEYSEPLRDCFYTGRWTINGCEKHSIFVSQASYSLKGLHFFLKALRIVVERFPDTKVYVGGNSLIKKGSLFELLKSSNYGLFVKKMLKGNGLVSNVRFLGPLDAQAMKEQYLSCNVYVLPSLIENSSNSLGEAQKLGVPCIASSSGGTPSLIRNGSNGFLYEPADYYHLASLIVKVFESDELCERLSNNAIDFSTVLYNRDEILKKVLSIYEKIGTHAFEDKGAFSAE